MRLKSAAAFFVRWALVFGVLMAPWPGLNAGYAAAYRTCVAACFRLLWPEGRVEFSPLASAPNGNDCEVRFSVLRGKTLTRGSLELNTTLQGYLPTVFIVALVAATPGYRHKGRTLIWALIAVNLYVVARAGLFVLIRCCGKAPESIIPMSDFGVRLSDAIHWVMFNTLAAYFVVPLAICAVLSVGRKPQTEWNQQPDPEGESIRAASRSGTGRFGALTERSGSGGLPTQAP